MTEQLSAPELLSLSQDQWEEARRRLAIIQPLSKKPSRTRADVDAAAAELNLRAAQVYRLLGRYAADPRLTTLVARPGGGVRGRGRISQTLESLIDEAIQKIYLTDQRATITELVIDIRKRCHELGRTPPSRKAITARVRAKPRKDVVARREGRKAARDRFAPAIGSLVAQSPFSLVQIDHTLVDVIVVDSVSRAPIQRPWLTLAIDVCTRCVAGFHLSLEPPSATSVALCLAHAALPKQPWLAARDIEADWPTQGLMARLHLDNAKEFRSEALRRGCEQYGIAIDYRPVRTPHYGGHIERLIGTMMGKVHLLPGTTFSSVADKGEYDPAKTAAMTIEELERWLGHAIAGAYHGTIHRVLGTTPLAAWKLGIGGDATIPGCGELAAVPDARRFLIDFLPLEWRRVRREGILLHSIHYWSDVLRMWIGEPAKMIVRYDPRDLSRIYLLAPDGQYYDLSYRDVGRPSISLWEHRLALTRIREDGRAHVDEPAIFRTVDRMRAIVDEALTASKAVRRHRERRLRVIQGGPPHPEAPVALGVEPTIEVGPPARQPYEDMLPVEEWS